MSRTDLMTKKARLVRLLEQQVRRLEDPDYLSFMDDDRRKARLYLLRERIKAERRDIRRLTKPGCTQAQRLGLYL